MAKYPDPFLFKPKNPHKYVGDPTKIVCRSGIEHRYLKFFDETPSILNYASEEYKIPYLHPVDGKVHRYFPDFVVKVLTKTGETKIWMIEIKTSSDTIKPSKGKKRTKTFLTEVMTWEVNQAKWRAADAWCKKRNIEFKVMTEQHIKHKF